MQDTSIPAGYLRNAAGHLVPEGQVREHDKLRDQVARELALEAEDLNARLVAFKKKALRDIEDLVTMAAERYGVRLGGKIGNVTAATFDGAYKVERAYAERTTFTEEIEAARELINQCIIRWSEGANANIRALVDRAFRTDSKGQLRTSAVLDLLRLEIDDDEWQRAMQALKDSIQSIGSVVYIRAYRRIGDGDQYQAIPLNLAAV